MQTIIKILLVACLSGCAVNSAVVQTPVGKPRVAQRQFRMQKATQEVSRIFLWTDGEQWQARLDPLPLCAADVLIREPLRNDTVRELHWFDWTLAGIGFGAAAIGSTMIIAGMANGSAPSKLYGPALINVAPGLALGLWEVLRQIDGQGEVWIREYYDRESLMRCPDDALGFPVEVEVEGQSTVIEAFGDWYSFAMPVSNSYPEGTYAAPLHLDGQELRASMNEAEFYPPEDLDSADARLELMDQQLREQKEKSDALAKLCDETAVGSSFGAIPKEFFEQETVEQVVDKAFRFAQLSLGDLTLKQIVEQVHVLNQELFSTKNANLIGQTILLPTMPLSLEQWRESLDEGCR